MSIVHSKYGASSAYTWTHCPASTVLPKVERASDKHAVRGTNLHQIINDRLRNGIASDYKFLSKDDKYNVDMCVDYVLECLTDETELFTEFKVELTGISNELFGTLDAAIVYPHKIKIIDFKMGYEEVNALNLQMIFYALGMSYLYPEIELFELAIVQPSINLEGASSTVQLLKEHLVTTYEPFFKKAYDTAIKVKYAYQHGDMQFVDEHTNAQFWCRWCDCKLNCSAIKAKFNNFIKEVDTVDKKEIKGYLDSIPLVEAFIAALKTYAIEAIKSGENIDNYYLRSNVRRQYIDDYNKLEEVLSDKKDLAFEKKLLPFPQMTKLIGKDNMDKITFEKIFEPSLARKKDKKEDLI